MQIFLSYRRGDAAGYAGRLYDSLTQRVGSENVFHDLSAIPPGEDFTLVLDRALDRADTVLAVIGPAWLSATTGDGMQRLLVEDDYVRLELARALARDLPVVPVLVGGAALPAEADLPEPLRPLTRRQAVTLHDDSWQQGVDELLRRLRGQTLAPTAPRRRWLLPVAGALLVAVVVAGLLLRPDGGGTAQETAGASAGSSPQPADSAPEATPADAPGAAPAAAACVAPDGPEWTMLPVGADARGAFSEGDGQYRFEVREAGARALGEDSWFVVLRTTMENATSEAAYHGDWHYETLVVGRRAFERSCFVPDPEILEAQTIGDALVGFEVGCEPTGAIELIFNSSMARLRVTDDAQPSEC